MTQWSANNRTKELEYSGRWIYIWKWKDKICDGEYDHWSVNGNLKWLIMEMPGGNESKVFVVTVL